MKQAVKEVTSIGVHLSIMGKIFFLSLFFPSL